MDAYLHQLGHVGMAMHQAILPDVLDMHGRVEHMHRTFIYLISICIHWSPSTYLPADLLILSEGAGCR